MLLVLVNFPGVEILCPHPSLEKERNISDCVCLYVLHKTPHNEILSPGCQGRQDNVPKKKYCMCEIVVLLIKANAFFTFSLPSSSSLLKFPFTLV